MTQAQADCLVKLHEMMDEHFEGWVCVTQNELDDKRDEYHCCFYGGLAQAKGLLVIGQEKLKMATDDITGVENEDEE